MASRGSAAKRPRTDDGDVEERTPNPDLWFADGSVVLASNSELFRVHRGMLAKTSSVFADLFSLPQPLGDSETYEDLPLVYLAGDDDDDVVHFLRCIYEHSYFQRFKKMNLRTVLSLLRMGTKYAVDSIRTMAIEHLATGYPSTLRTFDKHELYYGSSPYIFADAGLTSMDRHMEVIRVAHETSAEVLLPAAFYLVASSLVKSDIVRLVAGGSLLLEDLQAILVGQEKLQLQTRITVLKFMDDLSPEECADTVDDEEECSKAKQAAIACADLWAILLRIPCSMYPADSIKRMVIGSDMPQICDECSAAFAKSIEAGRQEIWSKLPTYFGLPSWDELLQT